MLKSLGAAAKRHPDVPLDYAIEYGERMAEPGFYFMDSPGNDLESVAGQVASGCNMIFFVTGNGSITNFPFVPTIKFVTTTERFQLLAEDMDINAGAYLDGTPMPELGAATLDYTIAVASGQRSVGEKAGHAQVQIWRDWALNSPLKSQPVVVPPASGKPVSIAPAEDIPSVRIPVVRNGEHVTTERVGLVLPTSLCSGQIARMCVETLNKSPRLAGGSISRYVTLVHTEGCGSSLNDEFRDTLLGYLSHPFVAHALLLEHGCESTHNDYFRQALRARGLDPQGFGWASIQLDGGIQNVVRKMIGWFEQQLEHEEPPETGEAGLEAVRLGLVTHGVPTPYTAQTLAVLTRMIVSVGGTVIAAEQESLLKSEYFHQLGVADDVYPTLSYASLANAPGFHLMAMPTRDWGEILTGLGAGSVNIIIGLTEHQPMPGHPLIPVLRVGENGSRELDVRLEGEAHVAARHLLHSILQTLSHHYQPQAVRSGNVYFQITRGLLGVSL
ncbi:MAG: UxaA family hydrolase [Anaerolineae bacterium]